jgi:hypothetical protein
MSGHLHAHTSIPEDKLPNESFFSWLSSHFALFVSQLLGLVGFVYGTTSTLYYLGNLGHNQLLMGWNPYIQIIVDGAHIVVLGFFIWVLINILDKNNIGAYRAGLAYRRIFNETLDERPFKVLVRRGGRQLKRFKRYFLFFWIAMLALYISFTFKHSYEITRSAPKDVVEATADKPNDKEDAPAAVPIPQATTQAAAGQSDHPSPPSGKPTPEEAVQTTSNGPVFLNGFRAVFGFLFFPFLTFALNNLSLLFVFWCFDVMYVPSYTPLSNRRHRSHVRLSSFFIAVLTLSFPLLLAVVYRNGFNKDTLTAYATVFDGVSGVLNAVVLALLIGRLDSKLIGLPSWLISLLYFYSAVQPLFAVFEQPGDIFKVIQTSVLIVVFGFKIYFFLIIVYALQTGRMLNYLICFPYLNRRINSVFDNQFEIKADKDKEGSFHISIKRKNADIYLIDRHLPTIEDCDEKVAELQEAVKREKSCHPKEQSGTHWVEVVNSHGHKLCRSISLKSEEEAISLIEESIDKIPYCKYNRG